MDTFTEYLIKKRIDPERFRAAMPAEWAQWNKEFAASGEAAFDLAKKFLLNPIRLQFPLTAT